MTKSTGKPVERQIEAKKVKRRRAPAGISIESRENQITRLVYDLVEERVRKKTATSQETTHFLKIGSTIAQLEKEKLKKENELLEAKRLQLESQKKVEELYANAMKAFRTYSGQEEISDEN